MAALPPGTPIEVVSGPGRLRSARPGQIRTVLLATDLSAASNAATIQAIDLTATFGARLLIVNVIDAAERVGPALSPYTSAPQRVDQARAARERRLLAIVD